MAPLYIDLKNNSLRITVPNLKFKHEVDEILNFAEIHLPFFSVLYCAKYVRISVFSDQYFPVYGQNKRFYP